MLKCLKVALKEDWRDTDVVDKSVLESNVFLWSVLCTKFSDIVSCSCHIMPRLRIRSDITELWYQNWYSVLSKERIMFTGCWLNGKEISIMFLNALTYGE